MRRRPGRAVALAAGILVASTSFTLLTSSVRTSQLITVGTVQRNARSAYDILVRPPGTRSPLELRAGLVQDNFLSGIYGGITLRQYRNIAALPGVAVAAPVANLGYITALGFIKVSVARYLTSAPFQAFRVTQVYSVGDGQHVFADSPQYVYLTRDRMLTANSSGLTYEIRTGRLVDTCDYFQVDPDGNRVPLSKLFPVAVLLSVASGALPAWRAARIGPLEAIVSPVRRVRRARPVRTLGRLAVRGLTRHPGRTALGAAALALGVAALTILLAVTIAYRGQVQDSLLGAAVLQQARAVDYLSAALALILGVAGAVDVLVISLRERMPELALLRACGWSRRDLWLLTLLEGLGIGVAGGAAGAAAGIAVVAGLGAGIPARAIAVAIGTAALGALLVTLAAAAPVTRLTRVAPVAVLTVE
jgi:hypothetical protein